MADKIMPCGHSIKCVVGQTTKYCGECAKLEEDRG